ncbi:HAMP domain-containing protein [Rhodobacteraceae bacterium NNCM2]|nr:HAMP domain-containing protein [Coraliihabitans acroporae]
MPAFEFLSAFSRLRSQLAIILAAAMLPAGVLAVVQVLTVANREKAARLAIATDDAELRAEEERKLLLNFQGTIRQEAIEISARLQAGADCEMLLDQVVARHEWMPEAVILDQSGTAICGADVPVSVAGLHEWEDEFLPSPRFVIGAARSGSIDGKPEIFAYFPISVPEYEGFALAGALTLSAIRRVVDDSFTERPFGLIGNHGLPLVMRNQDPDGWLPDDRASLTGPGTRVIRAIGEDGIERDYIAHDLLRDQVWAVSALRVPGFWDIALGSRGIAIMTPLILWVIAVSVAFVAIDLLVTRHVRSLQRVARAIGQGDFAVRASGIKSAPVEIRELGAAIDRMADNLGDREDRLRDLLSTQRSLLLEVHHRVKNNLQMISSLINIQLRRAEDPRARDTLRLVQDRIHSLALVHQSLYATERLDHVALGQLVRDLCEHLRDSLKPVGSTITTRFNLDDVTVDAAVATPVALFVTEAMANVFKHAVRQGVETVIEISLTAEGEDFALTIANDNADLDNGTTDGPSGLGVRLMDGFARQLDGSIEREKSGKRHEITLTAPQARPGESFEIRHAREGEG